MLWQGLVTRGISGHNKDVEGSKMPRIPIGGPNGSIKISSHLPVAVVRRIGREAVARWCDRATLIRLDLMERFGEHSAQDGRAEVMRDRNR